MRYILHSDLNNFYASVECMYNPELKGKAVAVVGDAEKRHGIVLAKNYIAKQYGVKTGDTIYTARTKCKEELVCVTADFDKYIKVSKLVKDYYRSITPLVESFGIDEAWLDITNNVKSFDEAVALADKIRKNVYKSFGVTVSVGVSFNKVFAKLGSDLKKPDAVTLISDKNYKDLIYPLPCEDLLYVGRATKEKLHKSNIFTIGELAAADPKFLHLTFGKAGDMLHKFACGLDDSVVVPDGEGEKIKSVGNSTTCPRDLKTNEEVKALIYILAEHVAERMRKKGMYALGVSLGIRDDTLEWFEKQSALLSATNIASDIAAECYKIFKQYYVWNHNVRAVGVRAINLTEGNVQINLFESPEAQDKKLKLEQTVESLRKRFGYNIIKRGNIVEDEDFDEINPYAEKHTIHPVSYKK